MKPTPKPVTLSPCQIIAWNFERARRARGWSQTEMAKRLEPYLGYRMSRAAVSKAERSLWSGPIRRFDADEIFALARIFNTPVGDFFVPPDPRFNGKQIMVNGKPGDPKARVTSKPLSRAEVTEFAFHVIGPEPKSEAERRAQKAESKATLNLIIEKQTEAAARAMRAYLEAHPDAWQKLIAGDPNVAGQITEAGTTATLEIETATQEQKLSEEIASASQQASAGAGARRRKR
jgi:transcriptional regulator with XRE-family HTH domain